MLQKPHLQQKLAEIWYSDAVEDDEAVRFEDMFGSVVVPVWLLTRRLSPIVGPKAQHLFMNTSWWIMLQRLQEINDIDPINQWPFQLSPR